VADAITLSKLADGVIWVVRFHRIRKRVIREAFHRFCVSNTPVVGVLINDIDFSRRSSYYYYSYRGYSKYYHSTGRSSRSASPMADPPLPTTHHQSPITNNQPPSEIRNPKSEISPNGVGKVTVVKPHSRKSDV
jgi:Mrp family chromosome partitioning ATPase